MPEVYPNEVGSQLKRFLYALCAIARRGYLKTFLPENMDVHLSVVPGILHDEDSPPEARQNSCSGDVNHKAWRGESICGLPSEHPSDGPTRGCAASLPSAKPIIFLKSAAFVLVL